MKKNTLIKLLAVLVMCFMIGAVLVACGETGPQGEKGEKGEQGEQGIPGAAGTKVEIGEDGYWYIDGDKTDYSAAGRDCEHIWDKDQVLVAHTQTTIGVTIKVCTKCDGADIVKDIHNFNTVVGEVKSGDTKVTLKCSVCEKEEEVALPAVADFEKTPGNCQTPAKYDYTYNTTTDTAIYTAAVSYTETVADHTKPAFDIENIDTTVWTLAQGMVAPGEENLCECEQKDVYVSTCTIEGCGAIVTELGKKPGHTWTTYTPVVENESDLCECLLPEMKVAVCDVCHHLNNESCLDKIEVAPAAGHQYGPWEVTTYPTATTAGQADRYCTECEDNGGKGCADTTPMVLPKLDMTDADAAAFYTYAVDADVECTEIGKATFTHDFATEGQENFKFEVALAHKFSTTYEVTVAPTLTTTGTVVIDCAQCSEKLEYTLPNLEDEAYTKADHTSGIPCGSEKDTYTIKITDATVENTEIEITFTVDCNCGGHSDKPAKADCSITVDKTTGDIYYIYKCDKCNCWIVAYVDEAPEA